MSAEAVTPLGWHVICGEALLDALRAVEAGEQPDMVYAQIYASSSHDDLPVRREVSLVSVLGVELSISWPKRLSR